MEIRTEFDQRRFWKDSIFDAQQVLTLMEVFHTDVMRRLVDNMTGVIIGVGGGDGFESVLLGWREVDDYAME